MVSTLMSPITTRSRMPFAGPIFATAMGRARMAGGRPREMVNTKIVQKGGR
jgi:hypothetical protein